MSETQKHKVVILGGGTAGGAIALALEKNGVDYVLIDNRDRIEITPCNRV